MRDHPNKLLIRTSRVAVRKQYETEIKKRLELSRVLKGKEMRRLVRIEGISREGDKWAVFTENYYCPRWNQDEFYLFLSELKSQPQQVSRLVSHVAQALTGLTRCGYAHLHLGLEALYFPISEGRLSLGESVKLGALRGCLKLSNAARLVQLPHKYRTSPEVINFIRYS